MEGHDGNYHVLPHNVTRAKTAASRYPQAITPVFLFELLMKASKRPEALTPEQRKTTATSIMPECAKPLISQLIKTKICSPFNLSNALLKELSLR